MNDDGISYFISKHNRMTGELKKISTDFQVQEINLNGFFADINRNVPFDFDTINGATKTEIQSKIVDTSCPSPIQQNQINRILPNLSETIDWTYISSNIETECNQRLGEKLGALEDLRHKQNDVSCGAFNNKSDRTVIHNIIRFQFPFVKTRIENTSGGDKFIIASADSAFLEVAKHNITYKEICRLFQFVNCRPLWECLHLGVDKTFLYLKCHNLNTEERKLLHHCLRKYFGSFIECKTIVKDDVQHISVRFKEKKGIKRKANSEIHTIILYKNNLELTDALKKLAIKLNIQLSDLKYAGVKDKRAVTQQFVSISNTSRQKIEHCYTTGSLDIRYAFPASSHLQLGQLYGNYFKIVLRNLKIDDDTGCLSLEENLLSAIRNVTTFGFVNYFGRQRFGGDELTSSVIGSYLLRRKFKDAVVELLKPNSDNNDTDPAQCAKRRFFSNKNPKETLKLMPRYKVRECLVLKTLERFSFSNEGCLEAFKSIPYSQRLFYVHSYSSLLWNQMVSQRCQAGIQVKLGDLVYAKQSTNGNQSIHRVTNRDIENSTYSIYDVIYPLLGVDTNLPANDFSVLSQLKDRGITMESFNIKELGLNVKGSYRHLLARPVNLRHQAYKDALSVGRDLLLEFTLKSSCYATMLIRELLKSS